MATCSYKKTVAKTLHFIDQRSFYLNVEVQAVEINIQCSYSSEGLIYLLT